MTLEGGERNTKVHVYHLTLAAALSASIDMPTGTLLDSEFSMEEAVDMRARLQLVNQKNITSDGTDIYTPLHTYVVMAFVFAHLTLSLFLSL